MIKCIYTHTRQNESDNRQSPKFCVLQRILLLNCNAYMRIYEQSKVRPFNPTVSVRKHTASHTWRAANTTAPGQAGLLHRTARGLAGSGERGGAQHRAPSQTGRTHTHRASRRTGTIAAQATALAGGPAVPPLPCSATQDTPREARHNGQEAGGATAALGQWRRGALCPAVAGWVWTISSTSLF